MTNRALTLALALTAALTAACTSNDNGDQADPDPTTTTVPRAEFLAQIGSLFEDDVCTPADDDIMLLLAWDAMESGVDASPDITREDVLRWIGENACPDRADAIDFFLRGDPEVSRSIACSQLNVSGEVHGDSPDVATIETELGC